MALLKDRAALTVLTLLGVVAIGGAVLTLRSSPAEADWASGSASGLGKKDVERIVREYILANPEILVEAMNNLQAREENSRQEKQRASVKKYEKDIFQNAADHVEGNPKGDVTIVEFMDYRCGYCKKARPEVLKLLESDKNIRIVVKEFPILGPDSELASRAAIASKQQGKYWPFHVALMAEPSIDEATIFAIAAEKGLDVARLRKDMERKEVKAQIDANHALAQKLGVDSTPTFIFGTEPVAGALSYDRMKELVAAARKAK
jgi:protein-disulfide isomerase